MIAKKLWKDPCVQNISEEQIPTAIIDTSTLEISLYNDSFNHWIHPTNYASFAREFYFDCGSNVVEAMMELLKSGKQFVMYPYSQAEKGFCIYLSRFHHNSKFVLLQASLLSICDTKLFQQEIQALSISNQQLSEFAYATSHDLQEPLRKIQNYIQMLRNSIKEIPETGDQYLNKIQDTATRMQDLIQGILQYSTLDNSSIPFQRVELNAVLKQVLQDLEECISEKNALIVEDVLPTIEGDAAQYYQLFYNLISNALKYNTHPQPTIKIICSPAEIIETRSLQLNLNLHYYLIKIIDNGIGFPMKYAESIFKLFYRLHHSSEFEGTGIGLALCKRIVEHHNGTITVQSELQQGSIFNIYLPENQLG
jgi:light-regulated signal transduction histidine kinase (bacteriophytochrome)